MKKINFILILLSLLFINCNNSSVKPEANAIDKAKLTEIINGKTFHQENCFYTSLNGGFTFVYPKGNANTSLNFGTISFNNGTYKVENPSLSIMNFPNHIGNYDIVKSNNKLFIVFYPINESNKPVIDNFGFEISEIDENGFSIIFAGRNPLELTNINFKK